MRAATRRWAVVAATAVASVSVAALPMSADAAPYDGAPSPGAAGVGDRLFPNLGNGGYDVQHYDLDLRYATAKPTQGVDGTVTITARATQALSRFDLDFGGEGLGDVRVNGAAARFVRDGEELVITPKAPIAKGATFTVVVRHFTADPTPPDPDLTSSTAFFITADGTATAGQPDGMHVLFPFNDHPSDPATFTFRMNVPKGTTAVANGEPAGTTSRGDRSIVTYEMRRPMATELTQVVVGAYSVVSRGTVGGVTVRDVVPTRLLAPYTKMLAVEKQHLAWMTKQVGPYPFSAYGSLIVEAPLGFALETQTLSIFDTTWFDEPEGVWKPTMVHELAHQWFGDSVTPKTWSDIWNNEGHATWYELIYAAQNGYLEDDAGIADFDEFMKSLYAAGDQDRADHGAVARPVSGSLDDLFSSQSYYGGALVLYALRQKIGAAAFEKVENAWVGAYAGRAGSTADYIAVASKVSGQDLRGFLGAWLYGTRTPPMPGHPDWTVAPVQAAAARSSTAGSPAALAETVPVWSAPSRRK